jgi:hypothetical protein
MQALWSVVTQSAVMVTQVAARFRWTQPERVQPLLEKLTALLRPTHGGAYAA